MTGLDGAAVHPDLEHYYDLGTDRSRVDLHLAGCRDCQAWLEQIHERIGRFACVEFVELVTAYLEDSVDAATRATIEDHLRLCEGCRNYVDEVQATIATMRRVGEETAPDDPTDPVLAGLTAAFRLWHRPSGAQPPGRPGTSGPAAHTDE